MFLFNSVQDGDSLNSYDVELAKQILQPYMNSESIHVFYAVCALILRLRFATSDHKAIRALYGPLSRKFGGSSEVEELLVKLGFGSEDDTISQLIKWINSFDKEIPVSFALADDDDDSINPNTGEAE